MEETSLTSGAAHAPVRVLHMFGRMIPGGAEIRLLELISRFRPEEFTSDVCALSGLTGSLDGEVRARGGEVIPLRLDARFPVRFTRLLRGGRYGVVHSHVHFASGPILALACRAGVPVRVAHFHATFDGRRATPLLRAQRAVMRRMIERYATDIIACGEASMAAVWREGWRADSRCRVVYDAVDVSRFERPPARCTVRAELGIADRARVFVHVGNCVEAKNHARLVTLFANIATREPSARLVLVGSGTDDPEGMVARAVRSTRVADRVMALGVRHDVPHLLAASDVLLLPSLYEGLPGVVLEACAAGVPVLASDLPGVREIASRLPLVRYLSLDASDDDWAAAALGLPDAAEALALRQRAAAFVRASVFDVDRAVEAHRALWRGSPSGEALACS